MECSITTNINKQKVEMKTKKEITNTFGDFFFYHYL